MGIHQLLVMCARQAYAGKYMVLRLTLKIESAQTYKAVLTPTILYLLVLLLLFMAARRFSLIFSFSVSVC